MSLEKTLEEFAKGNKRSSIYCAFQTLYLSLGKDDQKAIEAALAKNMPQNLIVKALRKEGHKASSDTLRAHIRGECRCPKS
jgi:hypothetical protein